MIHGQAALKPVEKVATTHWIAWHPGPIRAFWQWCDVIYLYINLLQDMEIVVLTTIKGIQQQRIYIYIYMIEVKFLSIKIIYDNKTKYIKI
jgi:hypothetical protein